MKKQISNNQSFLRLTSEKTEKGRRVELVIQTGSDVLTILVGLGLSAVAGFTTYYFIF